MTQENATGPVRLPDQELAQRPCWQCRAETGDARFCPQCGKIQPVGRNRDYFAVFGLPRKLRLDPTALETVFHELSRQYHPDRYRLASGRERMVALENSSVLNQAYRTLRDPIERVAYLVGLESGPQEERRDQPPQELFEQILEVQELLGDYRFADPDERASLRPQLAEKRDELQADLDRRVARLTDTLFAQWDALQDQPEPPSPEQRAQLIEEMRRLIGDRAYLRRVLNSLNDALEENAS